MFSFVFEGGILLEENTEITVCCSGPGLLGHWMFSKISSNSTPSSPLHTFIVLHISLVQLP